MRSEKILEHIDKTIIERIKNGERWCSIISYLKDNIVRYKRRDGYIQVSEKYLINNWDRIEWKKRMTTMLVIQSNRRISDINWIKKSHSKFPQLGSVGMYKLLLLKDKLKYNQSSESDSVPDISESSNS